MNTQNFKNVKIVKDVDEVNARTVDVAVKQT